MKGFQKAMHPERLLAKYIEGPVVQYLGLQFFEDHDLYWSILFYNPLSVPIMNTYYKM